MRNKYEKLFAVGVIAVCLLSVLAGLAFGQSQLDTSVVSMSGVGWSLKVDEQLQTDSVKSPISVSSAKAGSEKEISVVLNSLADVPDFQVQFKVQTQGLNIYKQLPLDKELNVSEYDFVNATVAMRKETIVVSRPENVVNSFACFDSSGRKVLHIFASKLVDANGDSVWVDSDLKDGLLTVIIPKVWLESASFPVVVDPTFGYTSIGASSTNLSGGEQFLSKFTCATTGTAENISAYMASSDSSSVKLVIYAADGEGGKPSTFLGASGVVSLTTVPAWYNGTFSVAVSTSTDYWIGFIVQYHATIYHDSGGSRSYMAGTWSTPSDPWVEAYNGAEKFSEYVDVNEGGAAQNLELIINDPDNTTYTTGTIPVSLTVANNESALQWNIYNASDGWSAIYGANYTTTTRSLTEFVNGTYMFGCVAANGTASIYENVNFTVAISPAATPTPTPTTAPTTTKTFTLDAVFLIIIMLIELFLIFYAKVPFLNFIFGFCGFALIGFTLQSLPFAPTTQVLLFLVSLMCLMRGGLNLAEQRG